MNDFLLSYLNFDYVVILLDIHPCIKLLARAILDYSKLKSDYQ
jgi:hypothetical protein